MLTSPTPGITITQGNSNYPDIPAGRQRDERDALHRKRRQRLGCGGTVQFHLAVTTAQGPFNVNFTVPEGPCPNYVITTQTGQPIVPGVDRHRESL